MLHGPLAVLPAVRALTSRLEVEGAAASAAVAPIAALAGVAGRMEAACSTLREAAELSSAFVRVGGRARTRAGAMRART